MAGSLAGQRVCANSGVFVHISRHNHRNRRRLPGHQRLPRLAALGPVMLGRYGYAEATWYKT
jgi:hypothetical protein